YTARKSPKHFYNQTKSFRPSFMIIGSFFYFSETVMSQPLFKRKVRYLTISSLPADAFPPKRGQAWGLSSTNSDSAKHRQNGFSDCAPAVTRRREKIADPIGVAAFRSSIIVPITFH
ncbi:hypothetical protein K8O68_00730, partial [Salipaludibacillus sp. CUR1]|uniref:hypothetical protein n=1 Tax=Salipaludibacillus sp. CUR1 TaxID=2820003 RepID=UPI001E5689DD